MSGPVSCLPGSLVQIRCRSQFQRRAGLPAPPAEARQAIIQFVACWGCNACDGAQVQQRLAEPLGPGDFFARKAQLYISFVDNPGTVPDPKPELKDPDDFNNPSNRPGR